MTDALTPAHTPCTAFAVMDILNNAAMLAPLNNRGELTAVPRDQLPNDICTGDTLHQLASGEYIVGYRQLEDVQAVCSNTAHTILRASLHTLTKMLGVSERAALNLMRRFVESIHAESENSDAL